MMDKRSFFGVHPQPQPQPMRGICLQCDQPITSMESSRHGPVVSVICHPCEHRLGVRVWTNDGRTKDLRSDPAPPVEVEGPREGLCQRCARQSYCVGPADHASLISWCCEAHHWSICLHCARQIMDQPHPLIRVRCDGRIWVAGTNAVPESSAYEYVFCPVADNRLGWSDQRVPVLQ